MIDFIRLIVGTAILSYASYTDIKYREASNKLWIVMAAVGFPLLFFYNFGELKKIAISISISFVIAYLLYFFGMGGADVKAMWAISILSPLPPKTSPFPIFLSFNFIFPLTILVNSLLLFIPLPILFFFYNLYKKDIEFPYCFFGYKIEAKEAKNKFVWSMEKNGKKSIFPQKDVDFTKLNGKIWVTPKMPFLLFIFIGFLISYIIGDMLFLIFSLIIPQVPPFFFSLLL